MPNLTATFRPERGLPASTQAREQATATACSRFPPGPIRASWARPGMTAPAWASRTTMSPHHRRRRPGRILGARIDDQRRSRGDELPSMAMADLVLCLAQPPDSRLRWKLAWEFLEDYRQKPGNQLPALLQDEPPATGGERWDTLLAALPRTWPRSTTWRRQTGLTCGSHGGRSLRPS